MNKRFIVKTTTVVTALGIILSGVESFQQQATAATPAQQISATVSDYAYPANVQAALDRLNSVRSRVGVSPVKLNPFLTKAAENHAAYLNTNNTTGHGETAGYRFYTGSSLRDRLASLGAGDQFKYTSLNEGLTYTSSDPSKGLDRLINAPLHRFVMVQPELTDVGIGVSGDVVVYTYGLDGSTRQDSVYPYNGQQNVPLSFDGATEKPNPLEGTGLITSGYVITMSLYNSPSSVTASMVDSKGVTIPVTVKENAKSSYEHRDWYIIPKKVLAPGETYTVTAAGKTWSFTTAGSPSGGTTTPGNDSSSGNNGSANPPSTNTKYSSTNIGVRVNGQFINVNPSAHSVNSNTFIPLRGVFEAMGASVQWNQAAKQVTITKDGTVIKLTVGSKTASINGVNKTLSTASFSKSSSTFVPLRFASEALGAKVSWDQANWTVDITS